MQEFGSGILLEGGNDEIDRKKLGAIVFADRAEMSVGIWFWPLALSTRWNSSSNSDLSNVHCCFSNLF